MVAEEGENLRTDPVARTFSSQGYMGNQHVCSLMEEAAQVIRSEEIRTPDGIFIVTIYREDRSDLYPGMIRYTIRLRSDDRVFSLFSTNSYEYSPLMPLEAERVAFMVAEKWEHELTTSPREFLASLPHPVQRKTARGAVDVVIIQGSPRADGNCGIIAGWAAMAARTRGKTIQVIYPHDMDIKPCSGCYQCYNTGVCSIDDQMAGVIEALRGMSLVIVCTPVYTNTVPGGLKLLIDRSLAYHAERRLTGKAQRSKGLLLSVAGRKGLENFACVQSVVYAFMSIIGARQAGEILIDGMDVRRDARRVSGLEEQVKELVDVCLIQHD
jgi:multimeric flavodoxin WrbA